MPEFDSAPQHSADSGGRPPSDPPRDPSRAQSDPAAGGESGDGDPRAPAVLTPDDQLKRLWATSRGRFTQAFPDIPRGASDQQVIAYFQDKLSQAKNVEGADDPPSSHDDDDPSLDPKKRDDVLARERKEFRRAREHDRREHEKALAEKDAENAKLRERIDRIAIHLGRGYARDAGLDEEAFVRYLRAPDPDDPFRLRIADDSDDLVVWDPSMDSEAYANGNRLTPLDYAATLPNRPGLSYLRRRNGAAGGTGSGGGAAAQGTRQGERAAGDIVLTREQALDVATFRRAQAEAEKSGRKLTVQ